MGSLQTDRVQKALQLEELRATEAVQPLLRELDQKVSSVITEFSGLEGVVGSGVHASRIAEAYVECAGKIIKVRVDFRRETLHQTPEIGTPEHFEELREHLETIVDTFVDGIPRAAQRVAGQAAIVAGPEELSDERLKLKADVHRNVAQLKLETEVQSSSSASEEPTISSAGRLLHWVQRPLGAVVSTVVAGLILASFLQPAQFERFWERFFMHEPTRSELRVNSRDGLT